MVSINTGPTVAGSTSVSVDAPWLSILLPVYNVERFLRECLDSILAQAVAGVEVVALDDVSKDGSPAILAEYEARYGACFKVMQHSRNQGISVARNTLLGAARGRYIWFMDSDDLLLPNAVTELKGIVDREDPDLVLCDYRKLRTRMKLKHRLRGEFHLRAFVGPAGQKLSDLSILVGGLFQLGQMHVWTKVSKRGLWGEDLLFPEGKYFQDMFTMPLLALRAKTFYYAPKVWVAYRQREGSIQSTPSIHKFGHLSESLLGFTEQFNQAEANPSVDARFFISHICAKNFVSVSKNLFKIKPPEMQAVYDWYRSNFLESLAVPLDELRRGYLRRGWLRRWVQLSFWLKQSKIQKNPA